MNKVAYNLAEILLKECFELYDELCGTGEYNYYRHGLIDGLSIALQQFVEFSDIPRFKEIIRSFEASNVRKEHDKRIELLKYLGLPDISAYYFCPSCYSTRKMDSIIPYYPAYKDCKCRVCGNEYSGIKLRKIESAPDRYHLCNKSRITVPLRKIYDSAFIEEDLYQCPECKEILAIARGDKNGR